MRTVEYVYDGNRGDKESDFGIGVGLHRNFGIRIFRESYPWKTVVNFTGVVLLELAGAVELGYLCFVSSKAYMHWVIKDDWK